MGEPCATVDEALNGIQSLEELEGFSNMIFNPPPGVTVKPITNEQQQRIAMMKIEFKKRANK